MADKKKSIEPNIEDLVNGWLKSYNLDYKLEQESLNSEIDKALDEYKSKSGGDGGNRPDAKLLLQDEKLNYYPILIEYKGYKDKLVKFDDNGKVDNRTSKNEPNYKNINNYAVNGAVHYANAVLHYTNYTDIIAIGVTGYKKPDETIEHLIGVYYVSKKNLGIGQEVDKYTDLSFLKKEISFISEFFPLIDLDILPISQDNIDTQLENIKGTDNTFLQISKKLNDEVFNSIRKYKKITEMNTEEINFRNLLSCFFITDFEPSDLIIEYASYDLLKLGISEEFIIEKLYKYFGDIINLGNG